MITKTSIPALFFLVCLFIHPKVGIGTTTANIKRSSAYTITTKEIISVMVIDNFPALHHIKLKDPIIVVFATGKGSPAKGFYTWSRLLLKWKSINPNKFLKKEIKIKRPKLHNYA